MALSDFLGQLGVDIGGEGGSFFSFSFLGDLAILLVLCAIAGAFTYWYVQRKSFNKTLVKYREVNGITRRVGIEKAKEVVLPGTSVRAFFLKNSKFFIPRPSIESGENEFCYFIRQDGEWMNVGIENVNLTLKQLELKFDHTDMRMANAALKRLVDKSYKKINWLKEYAPYIGFAVIIIMVAIGGYLVMGESAKVVGAAGSNVETFNSIADKMEKILSNMANMAANSGARSP